MANWSDDVTWPIEPHTRAKHEILRAYLQAWFPIMAQGNGRIIVLDGFAGPGKYRDGSDGSPVIALDTLLNHKIAMSYGSEVVFYFIEADAPRCQYLEELLASRYSNGACPSNVTWQVVNARFDEHVSSLLDELDSAKSNLAPTFAFVDPFGYSHTPMSVISRLMSHPRCEVFVNFMYEEANRFMNWDNPEHDGHYDGLFGTQDWRAIRQSSLPPIERERRIRELYARQLTDVGGAIYVREFRMRNKSNRTDYYLFFGTKNPKGLDKMKQAMWKVDPSGAFDFSDTTNPDQYVLFELKPQFGVLQSLLWSAFQGRTVTVQEVEDFVVAKTAFCSNHYKANVLKIMEKQGQLTVVNPSERRIKGTYPDKAMLLRFS